MKPTPVDREAMEILFADNVISFPNLKILALYCGLHLISLISWSWKYVSVHVAIELDGLY